MGYYHTARLAMFHVQGNAVLTFFFDQNVVDALKQLPPLVRDYDPESKAWTIDLCALPHALDYLEHHGYHALEDLRTVCRGNAKS
jgi:hypothetical protein